MKHLELAQLIAYADPALKGSEREELRGHIASCSKCRDLFVSVNSFKKSARYASPSPSIELSLGVDCIETEFMSDFLGQRLPENEISRYQNHIADCDICFERAAFFTKASLEMTAGLLSMPPTPERFINSVLPEVPASTVQVAEKQGRSFFDFLGEIFKSPLPAYGFSVALILFMVFGGINNKSGMSVIDVSGQYAFYEPPIHSGPSFGFADSGRLLGRSPARFEVSEEDNGDVRIEWAEIENINEYRLRVTRFANNGPVAVYETKTTSPVSIVPAGYLKKNGAYQFSVSGSDGSRRFTASGQFAQIH